jgi:hypothetical protein
MGADVSSSGGGGGGIAWTSVDVDKMSVVHDGYRGGRRRGHHDDRRRRRRRRDVFVEEDMALEGTEQHAIVVGYAGDAADGEFGDLGEEERGRDGDGLMYLRVPEWIATHAACKRRTIFFLSFTYNDRQRPRHHRRRRHTPSR